MIFWVLIVTIVVHGEPATKVAVTNFPTSQSCAAQGEQWLHGPMTPQRPEDAGKRYTISYECVKGVSA